MKTGLPHPDGKDCEPCARHEQALDAARRSPEVIEARAATEAALAAYNAGRDLPLAEWDALERAWRRASDEARRVFAEQVAKARAAQEG